MRGGAFLNGKEGRVGFRTDSTVGAVTSLALLERERAWEWVKDPPAGEGQVGHIQHCRAVTSFPFREGFLSPARGTERVVKPIGAWFGCGALLAGETERSQKVIIEAIKQSPL